MKILSTYLCLVALLISFSGKAQLSDEQIQQIDSLKEVISTAKHDTIKIHALDLWDYIIFTSDPELDLELNQQIIETRDRVINTAFSMLLFSSTT